MTKAHARLTLPGLPVSGDTDNWMRTLKWSCARAGECFSDGLEAAWLAECSSSTYVRLSTLAWENLPPSYLSHIRPERRRKLDSTVARALGYLTRQSQESVAEAAMLMMRDHEKSNLILRGRHIIWLIVDPAKSNHASSDWQQSQQRRQQQIRSPMKLETAARPCPAQGHGQGRRPIHDWQSSCTSCS